MLAMLDILRRWVKNDEDDKTNVTHYPRALYTFNTRTHTRTPYLMTRSEDRVPQTELKA